MANNTLLASDNFASGSLAAGWSALSGNVVGSVVVGSPNYVQAPALSVGGDQIFTGITWPADQTSEATATVVNDAGTYLVLWLRMQPGVYAGYQIDINNNSVRAYMFTNASTSVQIGSTVAITQAANDVYTASMVGSCLSVYQNGNRIFYHPDTTYTSGTPGFGVYSGTNVTYSKVFAWRGYSAVQQDGIWQKQGVVIAPKATDNFTASGIGTWINSQILQEGNAQLLSGTVFKVLFSAGNNIGYAESLDGKAWTRRSSPVLLNYSIPMLTKVGSVYWMHAQAALGGSTNFHAFTSPDMITWTDQGDTGLGLGAGGQWDSALVYSLQPVAQISGTWYGLYTGGNSTTTMLGSLGLATSADLKTWTKYGSNPLVSNFWNSQAIVKVGSTWYMWGEAGSPGRSNASASSLDPTETIRMQSTDLIHWTNAAHSLHASEMHASLNATSGQTFPNAIIDVGGKAYLFYTAVPNDTTGAQGVYQIALAIGPSSIANIITQQEDAVLQVASDSFTSGTGDLSANWTTPVGSTKLQIIAGNLVEATAAATTCSMLYSGATFATPQYSEVTIASLAASNYALPTVWSQSGASSDYEVNIQGPTGSLTSTFQIFKRISGARTALGPAVGATLQVGDVIRLSVFVGSDGFPILSAFQNGYLVQQVQDYSKALSSGSPGMIIYAATVTFTNAQISLWAGGNVNVVPFGVISGNAGVAGATISYSGATSGSVTADGSGNYTLPNLANGMYTITPSKAGVAFNPSSSTVTISNGNATGINFTAISSNKALVTTNNLLLTNGLLVTNALLSPDLLGGTNDWS